LAQGNAKKGDVLGAARLAGIMAAKKTHELIPLCHPLALTKVEVDVAPDRKLPGLIVRATCKLKGQTGVEMEALTAVSVACLTIYDMVKAAERGMRIEGIHLVEKRGANLERTSRAPTRGEEVTWRSSGRRCARRVLEGAEPLPAERVPLAQAEGRRARTRCRRARTQPPDEVSAMDGYAVRADDVASVSRKAQRNRRGCGRAAVRRQRPSGRSGAHLHRRRAAAKQRHGGHPGKHHARWRHDHRHDRDGARAQCPPPPASTSNRAMWACAKAIASPAAMVSLAAAMNHATLSVHRRPKIAIAATGDELVPPAPAEARADRPFQHVRARRDRSREGAEASTSASGRTGWRRRSPECAAPARRHRRAAHLGRCLGR